MNCYASCDAAVFGFNDKIVFIREQSAETISTWFPFKKLCFFIFVISRLFLAVLSKRLFLLIVIKQINCHALTLTLILKIEFEM